MADRVGQQLGNYRLIRRIGQGGFADVYLGEHAYLNTQAAIKVLQMRLAEEDQRSFLHEARTIAQLKHPSIVRVLEYDVLEDVPFLVMEYAINGTLRKLHPKGRVLPPATIVPYIRQVAAALQFAHNQKFIHRDVKPENMLLGPNNSVLLSDFGLAIIVQSSRERLQTVAGTVTYMAPEQLQGKPSPASDQYALAVVIYEWLSGERLFSGSFIEVATQHVLVPPPPLNRKNPAVSSALEAVIHKALAKDPEQRFDSVLEFAQAFEAVCQAEKAAQSRSALFPQGKLLSTYRKHFSAVLAIAWSPDSKRIASASADKTVQIWNSTSKNPALTYRDHTKPVSAVHWSPDGTRIASGSWDTTMQVWQAQTGRKLFTFRGFTQKVNAVAWSPDGAYIAAGAHDSTIQVRRGTTGGKVFTYQGHTSPVYALAWAPSGAPSSSSNSLRLASASGDPTDIDNTVRIWPALTGDNPLIYRDHFHAVHSIAWSPDGKKLASASADQTVHIWHIATGSTLLTYRGHTDKVNTLAWSPDGTHIVSGSDDRTAQIWDAATGETLFTYRGHTKEISSVAWSPNGQRIASASHDATVQVWQAQ